MYLDDEITHTNVGTGTLITCSASDYLERMAPADTDIGEHIGEPTDMTTPPELAENLVWLRNLDRFLEKNQELSYGDLTFILFVLTNIEPVLTLVPVVSNIMAQVGAHVNSRRFNCVATHALAVQYLQAHHQWLVLDCEEP